MKKEFPVLYAKVGTAIATPILFVASIIHIRRAITRPAPEIYPLVITAFGVTAALLGVCFGMAPSSPENSTPDTLAKNLTGFIHTRPQKTIISAVASGIVLLLSTVAVWAMVFLN